MTAINLQHGFVLALDSKGVQGLKPFRYENGEPVYRFKVQAVPAGNFLTADDQPFQVTQPTLKHWTDTFKAFANRGIPVPVLTGTHLEPTAEHSVGRVIGLTNDGKSLWATVELIGKDAPRIAASNSVSIYAEPEWKDTFGNTYQWPIRHLLLTPDPRIPGLKGFVPLAASNGKTLQIPVLRFQTMAKTKQRPAARQPLALDQLGAMNENGLGVPGPGDGAALPVDDGSSTAGDLGAEPMPGDGAAEGPKDAKQLKSHIKDHFLTKAHTVLDDEDLEQEEKLEAIEELLGEMERILEAFKDEEESEPQNAEPKPEDELPEHEEGPRGAAMSNMPALRQKLGLANAQLAQLTSRYRRTEITALFNAGKINRQQHQQLTTQYCDPRHVALSLSNEAFGNNFDQTMSVLSSNEEGLYGERTGVQGVAGDQPLALSNPYNRTEQAIDQGKADDASMLAPSSARVSRNGRK